MRERDQIAVERMEEKTGKTGLELLAALLREDGMNGGRWVYEREIEHRLTTLRATAAGDDGIEKPMIAAALAGLNPDAISNSFGVKATKHYATRIAHEEHHEAGEIVRRWNARPWGKRAVEEIVATLTDNHAEEVLAATEGSTGGAYADLIEILRDETTRELYTLLVTRMAQEANAASAG